MKRILHLTKFLPSFAGGIERATSGLADAGTSTGAVVTIVGAQMVPADSLPKDWLALPIAFRVGPVPVVLGYFRLARLFDQSDLIHVHLPNPVAEVALLAYLLRRCGKQKAQIVPVWHAPMARWPRIGALWSKTIHRLLYRFSHTVLVASPQLARMGKKIHATTAFHVLPFVIPSTEKAPKFSNLLDTDSFHVAAVGRLVPYKGFNRLLEALSRLEGNWRLTLVGSGPQSGPLKSLAARLGIADRVVWRQDADDAEKDRILADCQLFVLPSQTQAECFGLVVGEAFAHGRPVVTTDLSTGLAFLAREGKCGATIPVGSTEALTAALAELRDDGFSRLRAGRANYAFWKRELSPHVFEARYRSFLDFLAHARLAEGMVPSRLKKLATQSNVSV